MAEPSVGRCPDPESNCFEMMSSSSLVSSSIVARGADDRVPGLGLEGEERIRRPGECLPHQREELGNPLVDEEERVGVVGHGSVSPYLPPKQNSRKFVRVPFT